MQRFTRGGKVYEVTDADQERICELAARNGGDVMRAVRVLNREPRAGG